MRRIRSDYFGCSSELIFQIWGRSDQWLLRYSTFIFWGHFPRLVKLTSDIFWILFDVKWCKFGWSWCLTKCLDLSSQTWKWLNNWIQIKKRCIFLPNGFESRDILVWILQNTRKRFEKVLMKNINVVRESPKYHIIHKDL